MWIGVIVAIVLVFVAVGFSAYRLGQHDAAEKYIEIHKREQLKYNALLEENLSFLEEISSLKRNIREAKEEHYLTD